MSQIKTGIGSDTDANIKLFAVYNGNDFHLAQLQLTCGISPDVTVLHEVFMHIHIHSKWYSDFSDILLSLPKFVM